MGITSVWQRKVSLALEEMGLSLEFPEHQTYELLLCNKRVLINLVSLYKKYNPLDFIVLQEEYQTKGILLLHLWEDIWYTRSMQVLGRIRSVLGMNMRLHARKATIEIINQKQADDFLSLHHLQASARAKYKFALCEEGKIVAVACFSALRSMKRIAPAYRSAELIRFASLTGYTVTGGFRRLLKHFVQLTSPDDVMSYADRDWSLGNAYAKAGFVLTETTAPAEIWLCKKDFSRYFAHRLPVDAISNAEGYLRIFNTGNLKYILYL